MLVPRPRPRLGRSASGTPGDPGVPSTHRHPMKSCCHQDKILRQGPGTCESLPFLTPPFSGSRKGLSSRLHLTFSVFQIPSPTEAEECRAGQPGDPSLLGQAAGTGLVSPPPAQLCVLTAGQKLALITWDTSEQGQREGSARRPPGTRASFHQTRVFPQPVACPADPSHCPAWHWWALGAQQDRRTPLRTGRVRHAETSCFTGQRPAGLGSGDLQPLGEASLASRSHTLPPWETRGLLSERFQPPDTSSFLAPDQERGH